MKNQVLNFKIIITQDDDGIFVASCLAIPGCHTQATKLEEVLKRIKEAINLCLKVAQTDESYRKSIDFGQKKTSIFVAMSEVAVSQPSYV